MASSPKPLFGGSTQAQKGVGSSNTSSKVAPAKKKLTPADVVPEVTIDMLYTLHKNRSRMWLALLAFAIVALCIYVPVEWSYKSSLYSWGIDAIVDMQSDKSTSSKSTYVAHILSM
jgi:hypothetical protein